MGIVAFSNIARRMMGRKRRMGVHQCCDLSYCGLGTLKKRLKGLSVQLYMRELKQVNGLTLDTRPRHKAVCSATISEGLTGNCLNESNESKYALEQTNEHVRILRRLVEAASVQLLRRVASDSSWSMIIM